jgi:hypothetical protein
MPASLETPAATETFGTIRHSFRTDVRWDRPVFKAPQLSVPPPEAPRIDRPMYWGSGDDR